MNYLFSLDFGIDQSTLRKTGDEFERLNFLLLDCLLYNPQSDLSGESIMELAGRDGGFLNEAFGEKACYRNRGSGTRRF